VIQNLDLIGALGNVVANADGAWINMAHCTAVSFVCYEDDGSTIATLSEATDAAGTGAIDLARIDRVTKAPGTGGTWTEVAQTAAATYDNADDTVNDAFVFTVRSSDLTDGFTHIRVAVDGGTVTAITHGLVHCTAADQAANPVS